MNIQCLSIQYEVRKISDEEIPAVLNLCESNPQYYYYCPPTVSLDGIKSDMLALPPNKTYDDKYYIGFYQRNKLIAIMDLIGRYPNNETAFIGFFMVDKELQGSGIGTNIISECLQYLKSINYKKVKLGYVKENPQAKNFWIKNCFKPTGAEDTQEHYTVVIMERTL